MTDWSNPWFDPWKDLTSSQPWQSALEDWWGQFSKQPSSPHMKAFENIVSQSRMFFEMAEKMGNKQALTGTVTDWQAGLEQVFNSLKESFDHPNTTQAPQLFWQMPLANWERAASSMSGLPGEWFSTHAAFDPKAKLDQFLSTPGLGYTRESQAEQQKLARLLVDYQTAYQKYASFFVEVNKQSLDLLQQRLVNLTQVEQKPITTVRELYDLWIECSEESYTQKVLTDEYSEIHGAMVNALMALKHQSGQMMDDWAGALNMPTRQEMDTIHQRFQSSRRSSAALRQEVRTLQAIEKKQSDQIDQLLSKLDQLEKGGKQKGNKAKKNKRKKPPKGKQK
ncbi:MAG: class III poly(R)-hydroxyalkanoic acid synthase subunit PhaE [Arenicellales bacterium]|nr:class III poly(R)-hydroxyalkanoic acid synthase subunit PhaE [Arenicellales bacterium]